MSIDVPYTKKQCEECDYIHEDTSTIGTCPICEAAGSPTTEACTNCSLGILQWSVTDDTAVTVTFVARFVHEKHSIPEVRDEETDEVITPAVDHITPYQEKVKQSTDEAKVKFKES